MRNIIFYILLFVGVGALSCSRGDNQKRDTHKLSDEIVLDSISVDDFEKLMSSAISANDTADIQKLLGLAQSTYQKLRVTNAAEADNYAQRIKSIILGEPFLDNLLANKENFFFKFNNDDFETDDEKEEEPEVEENENDSIDAAVPHDDPAVQAEEKNVNATDKPESPDNNKANIPAKNEQKSSTSSSPVPPPPSKRVQQSFKKPADK